MNTLFKTALALGMLSTPVIIAAAAPTYYGNVVAPTVSATTLNVSGSTNLNGTLSVAGGGANIAGNSTIGGNLTLGGSIAAVGGNFSAPVNGGVFNGSSFTDSTLSSGQCVQAGTSGLLTTTGSACSPTATKYTTTGTLASNCAAYTACNFTFTPSITAVAGANCYAMPTSASGGSGGTLGNLIQVNIPTGSTTLNYEVFNAGAGTESSGLLMPLGVTCQ